MEDFTKTFYDWASLPYVDGRSQQQKLKETADDVDDEGEEEAKQDHGR
jgi:hypothetical protein